MNVLHICPHLGGGVGTVICDWIEKDHNHHYRLASLDFINRKAQDALLRSRIAWGGNMLIAIDQLQKEMNKADIVLVHWWDHQMLTELFSKPIPACRLVFWCHKNYEMNHREIWYPDILVLTSPIQNRGIQGAYNIWSTGNMDRFLAIQPKLHKGFNVGYVGTVDYKKLHSQFITMCLKIAETIPDVHFTIVGENKLPIGSDSLFTFTGKVDDVALYLAEMDVFGYPLRSDHYGTCEQALGEAMAAGVVPVVMDNPAERLIVKDSWNGFIAKSEKDYVKCLFFLYDQSSHKRLMANAARTTAKQRYSIDTMISKWNEIFESMMQEPKKERNVL